MGSRTISEAARGGMGGTSQLQMSDEALTSVGITKWSQLDGVCVLVSAWRLKVIELLSLTCLAPLPVATHGCHLTPGVEDAWGPRGALLRD